MSFCLCRNNGLQGPEDSVWMKGEEAGKGPKERKRTGLWFLRTTEIMEKSMARKTKPTMGGKTKQNKTKKGQQEEARYGMSGEGGPKSFVGVFASNAVVSAVGKESEVNKICKCIS